MTTKRFTAKAGLDNNGQTLTNVATPVNATDAVTKAYVDTNTIAAGVQEQVGASYPTIKFKKITGTCGGAVGAVIGAAHGLTFSKIVGIQTIVTPAGTYKIPTGLSNDPNYFFDSWGDPSNVNVRLGPSATALLNAPWTCLITYEV